MMKEEREEQGVSMNLSNNIVCFRKERGLTQEQLAALLNVSVSAVSKWEIGSNRPDLELLPDLAEIFQVSIDSLLGYEKSYKNVDQKVAGMNLLLQKEQYRAAAEEAAELLRRYPNDIRINKLLADAFYSLCFSTNSGEEKKEYAGKAVYYYEKSMELYDGARIQDYTKEELHCNIATLYALDEIGKYEEAVEILERYYGSRQYDNRIAWYLFLAGKKEEGRNRILKHCVADQIFVFNDLSILAEMYRQEGDLEKAILFMEAEAASYELFFRDEGGYADRAYAGKAYRISKLYEETGKAEQAEMWYEKARKHARIYRSNPSMLIASLRYCDQVEGRMIDSCAEILEELIPETL